MSATFTCPRCGRTSHHPIDAREGYCGYCHDWTGAEVWVDVRLWLGQGERRYIWQTTRVEASSPGRALERLAVVHAHAVEAGAEPFTVEFVFSDGEHVRFGNDPTIMVEPDYVPPDELMGRLEQMMRRRHPGYENGP